jgi:hypothetical protein
MPDDPQKNTPERASRIRERAVMNAASTVAALVAGPILYACVTHEVAEWGPCQESRRK